MEQERMSYLASKLNLDTEVLDNVVDSLTDSEYEEVGSGDLIIWPNISRVTESLKRSNILRRGKYWIAIEANYEGEFITDEQNEVYEYLESTKYGAPVLDCGCTFDMYI